MTVAAYIPHGGGPLPLLGDPSHGRLIEFLTNFAGAFPRPDAVICVSAHYEGPFFTVAAAERPGMIYDYYGFPPEAYKFRYPAPGAPDLAGEIAAALHDAGLKTQIDAQRGYDHGAFVPLMLLYPQADIPVAQLSLNVSLDPAAHISAGEALAAFKDRNYLILGSGMSFHNMTALMNPAPCSLQASGDFHHWLIHVLTSPSMTAQDRLARLANWATAPSARYCHPREEHLLPLHVCAGYAAASGLSADIVFDEDLFSHRVVGALWR